MNSRTHFIRFVTILLTSAAMAQAQFTKIGESSNASLGKLEYAHSSALVDDKIWIFSKTFSNQPSFNWGHRVVFAGGYSTYFDLTTHKWAPKQDYKKISEEENLDEVLFVFQSKIFLLLHQNFGGMEVKKLMQWDTEARHWKEVSGLKSDEASKIKGSSNTTRCELIAVKQERGMTDCVLFISKTDGVAVHRLTFGDDGTPSFSSVASIPDETFHMDLKPVMAARWGNKVYILGGVHGCGFMFQANSFVVYDGTTKKANHVQLDGDHPPFDFSGSSYTTVMPSTGFWIHATGSTRRGMTDSDFNGGIWAVPMKEEQPKWLKMKTEVPNYGGIFLEVTDDGTIYIDDKEKGVLAGKLS